LLFGFKRSKHHHIVPNGFDNETIVKVYDVGSRKDNRISKACCSQPSILLHLTSNGF
jgi:hypothetical protein